MRKIIIFFKEVRAEFKQISWPKRESLIQSTIVVISISVIVSLVLGGFDYIFTQSIGLIGKSTSTPKVVNTTLPTITSVPSIIITPTITSKNKK